MACLGYSVAGQQIHLSGKVIDRVDSIPLTGANIALKKLPDSTTINIVTADVNGHFAFNYLDPGSYHIQTSYIGYKTYNRPIELGINPNVEITILMAGDGVMLDGVDIVGKIPPVTQKGDTSEMRANSFKVNPDANAEDLVRKMPGITVEDGKVKAQGEDVRRVLVDGKVFFGDDPSVTLRNMPADMIDRVQVFDRASDQAQFTGLSDGNEEKTINIITRPDRRMGNFGRIFGGYAPDDKYKVGGVINSFKNDTRLTILAMSNNVNEQNFEGDDMAAMQTTGGGGRRGGPGGMRSSNPLTVNNQNGVVKTHAIGVNYNDEWGKKITFSGSAFGNLTNTNSRQETFRQYYSDQTYSEKYFGDRDASSYRVNGRVEYRIDSSQSIIYSTSVRYGNNNSTTLTLGDLIVLDQLQSKTDINNKSTGSNLSLNNDLMYRLRFGQSGRSLITGVRQNYSNNLPNTIQDLYTLSYDSVTYEIRDLQEVESNNYNRSLDAYTDFTQPIFNKENFVVFSYNYNIKNNDIDKLAYNLQENGQPEDREINETLSNVTNNRYQSHRPRINLRHQKKDLSLSAGVGYQYSTLESMRTFPETFNTLRTFNNVLPEAMVRWKYSKTGNFRLFYRTNTQEPSVNQLQDVVDNSNTLNLRSGNSNLGQSYGHRLFTHFSTTNPNSMTNLFIGGGVSLTDNYIGNQVVFANRDTILANYGVLPAGAQYTYPINLDGHYNIRGFASFGFPFAPIKSNINLSANTSYTNAPSRINDNINFARTASYGGGLTISSNFSQNMDFTLATNANLSNVKNTMNIASDNNYFSQNSSARINWIFLNRFVVNSDFSYYYNLGLASNLNVNYAMWNAAIGYKFLPRNAAEIRLQAFDILNNNTSLSRSFEDTYYEDVLSNVLNRYFMLTFSYKIQS